MAILYNKVNTFSSDEMITPGRDFSCSSSMTCLASIPQPVVVLAPEVEHGRRRGRLVDMMLHIYILTDLDVILALLSAEANHRGVFP